MAFALTSYYMGEKHYVHRDFGKSDNSPSVSRNMNFAMLFAVESDARRFKRKNELLEFQPEFVALAIKAEEKSTKKIYYTRLRDLKAGASVDSELPDFLKGV